MAAGHVSENAHSMHQEQHKLKDYTYIRAYIELTCELHTV